jgi:23S rRNA pseudouridine1911/1915/1917 synthase
VVAGTVDADRGVLDLPLRRDPADRRRMIVSLDGAPSVTRFSHVASGFLPSHGFGEVTPGRASRATADGRTQARGCVPVSLLRCSLVTGRMHQIRAHLLARGWPIVGDPIYGPDGGDAPPFPRQALHACRVALTHPRTRERLQVEAPLPDDMRALLAASGLGVCER